MRWFSLALGLGLLLAACGGDSGPPSGASSPIPTTAPATATVGPTTEGGATPAASATGSAGASGTRTATAGVSGSAAPTGQGQATQEACRVVTKAEVEMATGLQLRDGMYTPGGLGGTCIYEQQRAQPSDLADSVYVQPFTSQTVYNELRGQASGAQEVPGLGDRAYASPGEVAVMKGARGVYISWVHVAITPGATDAQRREKLIALARVAVARL